jgi:hypothetical protein
MIIKSRQIITIHKLNSFCVNVLKCKLIICVTNASFSRIHVTFNQNLTVLLFIRKRITQYIVHFIHWLNLNELLISDLFLCKQSQQTDKIWWLMFSFLHNEQCPSGQRHLPFTKQHMLYNMAFTSMFLNALYALRGLKPPLLSIRHCTLYN